MGEVLLASETGYGWGDWQLVFPVVLFIAGIFFLTVFLRTRFLLRVAAGQMPSEARSRFFRLLLIGSGLWLAATVLLFLFRSEVFPR